MQLDSGYGLCLPAPVLRPFISHYAGFCARGLTPGTHAGLPSRHAHLIISLGAPIECPPALVWAWRQLAASHGSRSIEGLARGIGWSRPHFTERFRLEFGVSPKTAARIFRFERACRLIKDARPRLADVAVACGYHDQAHMTRDWNRLAGCSPRTWIASELPFLQDYELSGGDDDI